MIQPAPKILWIQKVNDQPPPQYDRPDQDLT